MASKSFYYLIDSLTAEKAAAIRTALSAVSDVLETKAHLAEGIIEVKASRDMEAQVRMACGIAKATLRMRVNRRAL